MSELDDFIAERMADPGFAEAYEREVYAEQHDLAKVGRAEGQCSSCGAYRADRTPPLIHRPECSRG